MCVEEMTPDLHEARHEVIRPLHTFQIRDEHFGLILLDGFDAEDALRRYLAMRRAEDIEVFTDPEGVAMTATPEGTFYAVPRSSS
jgi:hypothetical protein